MTDLKLACMGSIILYGEDDTYCMKCPLRVRCAVAVAENRVKMAEALYSPPTKLDFGAQRTVSRRALAMSLSSPAKVVVDKTPRAPAKAPTAPVSRPVVVAPVGYRTPLDALSLDGLQKKVRERLTSYNVKGIDLSAINEGLNPFQDQRGCSFDFVYVGAAMSAPLTKKQLVGAITQAQIASGGEAWSMASVQSNMNIVGGALLACGYDLLWRE